MLRESVAMLRGTLRHLEVLCVGSGMCLTFSEFYGRMHAKMTIKTPLNYKNSKER